MRLENHGASPRSSVMLATIATSTAGTAATTENSPMMRICRRAPARPRRRAEKIFQSSRPMTPTSNNEAKKSMSRRVTTTRWVGATGVSPASTRNVTVAESKASATASAPNRRNDRPGAEAPPGSAIATSSLLMQTDAPSVPDDTSQPSPDYRLVYLYNNVARL